jgi:hypothetical protein
VYTHKHTTGKECQSYLLLTQPISSLRCTDSRGPEHTASRSDYTVLRQIR